MIEDIDYNSIVQSNEGVVPSSKAYSSNDWFVTVRLSDFYGARIETMETDEQTETDFLCIPIKDNGLLRTSRNNVLVTFKATMAGRVNNRFTHTLRQVIDMDVIEKRKKLGFDIPTIGHMRPANYKKKW